MLREIVKKGDPVLEKKCHAVDGYDIEVHCTGPSNFKAVYREGTDVAIKSNEICEKRIIVSQLSGELKRAFSGFDKVEIQNPNYIYRRNVQ